MRTEFWLLIALGLCIAEILAPGTFLIFVSAGAALAGIVALFYPALVIQLGVFAAGIILALIFGMSLYRSLVNSRIDSGLARGPIGETGIVEEAIAGGTGKVRVRDISWLATGPNLAIGRSIIVVARDGTRLEVQPVDQNDARLPQV